MKEIMAQCVSNKIISLNRSDRNISVSIYVTFITCYIYRLQDKEYELANSVTLLQKNLQNN